ncbi:gliding motility-associated ABC transporter ATP-binding subunit GldA [Fulvivirgaceae bacterium BMA10]|uniref:Gliding motility-associated ABC transporter ATP-binding subunit GldA n=1 Tax=Splendidivirga corallicola TaxID=3051826 RepID=A0ABT8KSC4_9BACT|nr:gliding motility-associated ABC transporter ATP-binding subunit GldA [Fulvivirgaceae bacterium BMA10]
MSITVKNLTKLYGAQKAVDDISFEVNEGEILGFLGPNGAGKSTTMKIATCYVPPTEGTVQVCGYDVVEKPIAVRKVIGYLPEHNPLYLDMYVHEYLGFIGSLHGLSGKSLRKRVEEMIGLCGLTIEQNKKIGALSKGYRQRVGLAQAMVHDPKVFILDEPTTGLDPNQILEIRKLIKNISQEKTVIFSTHIMQEVQALCDRVIIINSGKIVADSPVDQLKEDQEDFDILSAEFSDSIDQTKLEAIEGVIEVAEEKTGKYIIKVASGKDIRGEIFKFATENEKTLLGLSQEERSLESIFHKLTKK